jgi:uncharacterized membrane protein
MYELSHDTLVAPILKAKAQRAQLEQAKQTEQLRQEAIAKRRKKIVRAVWLGLIPIILVILVIVLIVIVMFATDSESALFVWTFLFTFFLFISFMILIGVTAMLGFVYEFIVGESILSKLRKRTGNPAKQKGLLTKIGRWLS